MVCSSSIYIFRADFDNSLILYVDTGASKLIADGKIKLKSDSVIKSFTERSIVFENGTELAADVVVFATGCVYFTSKSYKIPVLNI